VDALDTAEIGSYFAVTVEGRVEQAARHLADDHEVGLGPCAAASDDLPVRLEHDV